MAERPDLDWVYRAKPVRVVDGDTIVLLVDNGFRNREEHSFRLLGVDTPEIFSGPAEERARGAEAKTETARWLAKAIELGGVGEEWPLVIRTQKDKQTFNRYIAEVWDADGECLNDLLRALGHGATG
jgi:endonuclease YncB( thermonuclease family)